VLIFVNKIRKQPEKLGQTIFAGLSCSIFLLRHKYFSL